MGLFSQKKPQEKKRVSFQDQASENVPQPPSQTEREAKLKEQEAVLIEEQQQNRELQREINRLKEENSKLQERGDQLQNRVAQLKEEKAEVEEKLEDLQASVKRQVADISFWEAHCTEVEVSSEILGSGACGMVFSGWFRGQKVAVKQLHPKKVFPLDPLLVQREISLMSKIHHPNLLTLIAAILDHPSGSPLLLTELMDTSLRNAYEKKQLAEVKPKLSVIRDVAAGLNYLHLHHETIIHGDITSANVLLLSLTRERWLAKLSDFGSAKLARLAGAIDPYTAPEMTLKTAECDVNSPKLDVYSYGVLVCEVIAEQYPEQKTFPDMLQSVRNSWPAMHELITSCTHTDPADRLTMSAVLGKLPAP